MATNGNKDNNVVMMNGDHTSSTWRVHKFGGTSVANADCFLKVAEIIEKELQEPEESKCTSFEMDKIDKLQIAAVVSAMGGKPKVTDLLLNTVKLAAKRECFESVLNQILQKHRDCLQQLDLMHLLDTIQSDLRDVRDILKTVSLMKWQATRISELVSGYGELWSAQILAALLSRRAKERYENELMDRSENELQENPDVIRHEFAYLDARRVIIVDEDAIADGAVCWEESREKLNRIRKEEEKNDIILHFVMTGYVASNTRGVATTLQRDGSDYSAAILGKLLHANSITIWTDVDGVLSADPRRVPRAHVLEEVSFTEAMELAYFGAKVIHPKTMQPALPDLFPIFIRNTFRPELRGTRIFTSSSTHLDREKCVCGFSSVENMALINVEGSGLIGVPGVAKRLFGTLEAANINVVLISQASSEHTITFATLETQASKAKDAISEEFRKELFQQRISNVDVKMPCSIIAAVGDGMMATAGVCGRFFSALGDARINVLAISQGSSERNISAVVHTSESTRALGAAHAAFRLSYTTVRVGVVVNGELGQAMLRLLEAQRSKLRMAFDVDLQVCAIMAVGSNNTICLKDQLPPWALDGTADSLTVTDFNDLSNDNKNDSNRSEIAHVLNGGLENFLSHVFREECAHHAIFDCTNNEIMGTFHSKWLQAGVHVVTANNTGLSGSKQQRAEISAAERCHGKLLSAHYLREVTVGGGLPVISTLRNLLHTGDQIRRMDGILSVSMSYIMYRISPPPNNAHVEFDEVDSVFGKMPSYCTDEPCLFSTAVREAVDLGLMEEDPTKDLNNEYVSRVLMVLAKELGMDRTTSTEEIQKASEALVPLNNNDDHLDFRSFQGQIDDMIQEKVDAATKQNCVLRYISSVDVRSNEITTKCLAVPSNHVFATTPPSCECVRFFTHRHCPFPLVVQGPSAGADSTASALLAELLQLMRSKVGHRYGALSRTPSSAFLS